MKKFELIVGLIALLGMFLRVFHVPGSSILIVLVFTTLSMFYNVFSFALFNSIRLRGIFRKTSYKDTNAKRIIGAIGLGWALAAIVLGGLFKLLFLPGGNIQLLTGLVSIGLILPIVIIFYFRTKANYYKRILKRIAIYGGLGLLLYLRPTPELAMNSTAIHHHTNILQSVPTSSQHELGT